MLKKLCLLFAFSLLPIITLNGTSNEMEDLNEQITHIFQEKQFLMLDLKKVFAFFKKAINYQQSILGNDYEPLVQQLCDVVLNIINSEEFNCSIREMTDYQTEQIVNKGICFNDIIYNDFIFTYSVNHKIDIELTKAFPCLDQQIEQLFNIFYVTIANYKGGIMLIEKLTVHENALRQKLSALTPSFIENNE